MEIPGHQNVFSLLSAPSAQHINPSIPDSLKSQA